MGVYEFFQILAHRAEILLRLERLYEAEITISKAVKLEPELQVARFFGMIPESYVFAICAQVELALGRLDAKKFL